MDLFSPFQSTRNFRVAFNKFALVEGGPKLSHKGSVVSVVEISKKGLDSLSCLKENG